MSTAGIEIGNLSVHSFMRRDAYGLCYNGTELSTQKSLLILALIPFTKRPITLDRLTRALSGVRLADNDSLAQIQDTAECSMEQGQALLHLAQSTDPNIADDCLPQFIVSYYISDPVRLDACMHQLTGEQKISIIDGILSALEQLHKRRSYHLSLDPKTIWMNEGTVKLTHQGLFGLFKKRGLSIKKESSEPLDQAISHRVKYASPEGLFGRLSNQSSDLFAVGALIYELFVGPLPEPEINADGTYQRKLTCSSPEWNLFFSTSNALHTKDRYPNAGVMQQHFTTLPQLDASTNLSKVNESPIGALNIESDELIAREEDSSEQDKDISIDEPESGSSLDPDQTFSELSSTFTEMDSLDETALDPIERSELNQLSIRESLIAMPRSSETPVEDHESSVDSGQIPVEISESRGTMPGSISNLDIQEALRLHPISPTADDISETDSHNRVANDLGSDDPSITGHQVPHQSDQQRTDNDHNQSVNVTPSDLGKDDNHGQKNQKDVQIQKNVKAPNMQTLGFFSGGTEVSSSQFQSLKSQLSSSSSTDQADHHTSVKESQGSSSPDLNEMAFGTHSDDLSFNQSSQDERTFLEFSDVDDQTIFEEDQDLFVEQTHTNTARREQYTPPASNSRFQTMAYVSQGIETDPQADLQTPDFLNELPNSDPDPSRVMPIPSKSSHLPQTGQQSSAPLESISLTPSPFSVADEAKPFSAVPVVTNKAHAPELIQSQILGDAHDWPGSEGSQPVYTPPQQRNLTADNRKAPKMRGERSFASRLFSVLVPLVFISLGAVGVYWVSSNWSMISKMIASETPLSLNISTVPSDMRIILNNKPQPDKTPLIHRFEGRYTTGQELPIRFLWNRKMHATKIKLPAGALSLHFIAEQKKTKVSRYRKRSKAKPMIFAQGSISSTNEPLNVLFEDQQIGQTPMIIIGQKDKPLLFKVVGPGIEKTITLSLNGTKSSDVVISNSSKTAP